jgi:hypothetical protein
MLEAGNIIQGAAEWGKLLEGAYDLVADVNMWMFLPHHANIYI